MTVYVQLRVRGEDGRVGHCKGLGLRVKGMTPERVFKAIDRAVREEAARQRAETKGIRVPGGNDAG